MAPIDPKPQEVATFDPIEWADSEPDAISEQNASSEPKADKDGVSVSIHSSSDLEAMTTPEATFLGVPRVTLAVGVGVRVPGGMY